MSNGAYGGPYYVEGSVGANGFQDDGSSAIDTPDVYGNVLSLAKGESQNSTTASTDGSAGIKLSISSIATAFAEANYSNGYAHSPAVYKPDLICNGTFMSMSWNVDTNSSLTVTNMVSSAYTKMVGGTAWAVAMWSITVESAAGEVLAQYSANNGPSFTAPIPANTVVRVYWIATTGAKASGSYSQQNTAFGQASVSGQIAITPAP